MSVDPQYGIGVDGQGRVIRKACLPTVMKSLTSFIKRVYIKRVFILAQLLHMVCRLLKHRILFTDRHLSQRSRSKKY